MVSPRFVVDLHSLSFLLVVGDLKKVEDNL